MLRKKCWDGLAMPVPWNTQGRGTKERVPDPLVMSAVSARGGNFGMVMSALEWRQ